MEKYKTIKELADELGISKQAVRKYFDKMPTELIPTKVDGKYMLSVDTSKYIARKVRRKNGCANLVESTVDQLVGTSGDTQMVNELTDKIFFEKDERIRLLEIQNDNLNKLLDQQQQLTLQANKQIEKLQAQLFLIESSENEKEEEQETENKIEVTKKWYQFWK